MAASNLDKRPLEGDEEGSSKRTSVAIDDEYLSACDKVFGAQELAEQIFSEAALSAYQDGHTWSGTIEYREDVVEIDTFRAYACLARFQCVNRTWNRTVANCVELQRTWLWRPKSALISATRDFNAGQSAVSLRPHPFLPYFFWHDLGLLAGTFNDSDQLRFTVSTETFDLIEDLPLAEMILCDPPVTLMDLVAEEEGNTSTPDGFNADGEVCEPGSRLATHHKPSGFTPGDVKRLADGEFKKRAWLEWIVFKSMDHVKAQRLAMIKATPKSLHPLVFSVGQ